MSMFAAVSILITSAAFVLLLSILFPAAVGDQNPFMKQFIGTEYLNLLGVMLTITLASVAPLYLQLKRLENRTRNRISLAEPRRRVKQAASSLLILFLVGVVLVILKPGFSSSAIGVSLINGTCLFILLWYLLLLYSLTEALFAIIDNDDE